MVAQQTTGKSAKDSLPGRIFPLVRRLLLAAVMLLTVLTVAPLPASAISSRDVKILGGAEAAPGQFPWMAALVDIDSANAADGIFCGGTVITPRVVLTAAHCVQGTSANQFDVVVGRTRLSQSNDGERVHVSQIMVAPGWNSKTLTNDAALVQLSSPVSVTPLALVDPGDTVHQATGQNVLVSGWGATAENGNISDALKYVRLHVYNNSTCTALFGSVDGARTLCVGSDRAGEDSCQGDSGGPLFFGAGSEARLIGLVSFGDGCGHAGSPGVYTRVSALSTWITQTANALNGSTTIVPPPSTEPPTVHIGKIRCRYSCVIHFSVAGRQPAGGIVLNVVRKRSKTRKAVDRFVFAKQDSNGQWTAKTSLPFGKLTLYAIPLTAAQDDLDGNGDVRRIEIVPN